MAWRWQSTLVAHRIACLIVGWSITRLLLLVQLVLAPDAFVGDVRLYSLWSLVLAEGRFPVGDPFWQYPPGAGVVFATMQLTGPDPIRGFIAMALAADGLIMAVLILAARRRSAPATPGDRFRAGPWLGPVTWVVGGLLIGPVMLARFDLFPTAAAVAAVLLAMRPWASGAMAGLGALLKAWPILVLAAIPRRQLPKAAAASLVVFLIGWVAISTWAQGGVAFLGEQGARGLQIESVAALPYLLAASVGFDPQVVLSHGAFELAAPGAAVAGLALTALGALVLATVVGFRLLGRLEDACPGDVALAVVLVSVATSRVFSPQYGVWLVGLAAAAVVDQRSRLRGVTGVLLAMSAVTGVLFPWAYGSLLDAAPYAVALQCARVILLLVATITALVVVLAPSRAAAIPGIRALARPR